MQRDSGFTDKASPSNATPSQHTSTHVRELEQLRHKYQRIEMVCDALLQINHIAAEVRTIDDFYNGVHCHIKSLIAADNFFIATFNHHTERLEIPFFIDEKDSHPALMYPDDDLHQMLMRGLTGYVFRLGETALCSEADLQQLVAQGEVINLGSECHQWLGVPIRFQARTTGVLVVQTYDPEVNYGLNEVELMEFISHHISGVLERLKHQDYLEQSIAERTQELSEAYDKLKGEVYQRRRTERLKQSLFDITELSVSGLSRPDFYSRLHSIIGHLIPANNCYIALIDREKNELSFPFYVSQLGTKAPVNRPMSDGLSEYLLSHGKPLLLNQADIRSLITHGLIYTQQPKLNNTQQIHQWIGAPLFIDGELTGALVIFSLNANHTYQPRDLELLTFVCQHIGTAIERKQQAESLHASYEQLEEKVIERTAELGRLNQHLQQEIQRRQQVEQQLIHDAKHDALTHLPNRAMFTERLAQAVRRSHRHDNVQFALLFIDLDHFKQLNDTLGHLEGDKVLIETAHRLSQCVREIDTLGRLGGDEFVVLLEDMASPREAEDVAERILASLSAPFNLGDNLFQSSASIGIAVSNNAGESAESMLRNADSAMYQAKAKGKSCYMLFDSQQHSPPQHKDQQRLREALQQGRLFLQAEPIARELAGLPAFYLSLGWQHPDGVIGGEALENLASLCNLSIEYDRYLLTLLAKPIPQWLRDAELQLQLSSAHLKHKHALQLLTQQLHLLGDLGQKLWLFFNEDAFVQDIHSHLAGFEALSQLDIHFGLTHYGSGFSSLQALLLTPIKGLRLAHHVDDESGNQLRLLCALALAAKALGLEVIGAADKGESRSALKDAGVCAFQTDETRIIPQP